MKTVAVLLMVMSSVVQAETKCKNQITFTVQNTTSESQNIYFIKENGDRQTWSLKPSQARMIQAHVCADDEPQFMYDAAKKEERVFFTPQDKKSYFLYYSDINRQVYTEKPGDNAILKLKQPSEFIVEYNYYMQAKHLQSQLKVHQPTPDHGKH